MENLEEKVSEDLTNNVGAPDSSVGPLSAAQKRRSPEVSVVVMT